MEDIACSAVNAVPGFSHRPEMAVTAAVNGLAASGAGPESLVLHVLLPPGYEEAGLREAMRGIAGQAAAYGMRVSGGHTEVTGAVNRPVYAVTAFGRRSGVRRLLRPGDDLVLTKWIALAGTAAIAERYEERLKERYPSFLIDTAKDFARQMSVLGEAWIASACGPCAMHDLSQGGVFGALWEMAELAGVGLEADLRRIPIRQESVEICEYFDVNPYCLYSAGALLIGTENGEAFAARLAEAGIPAAVFGRATAGRERILRNGEDVRYLDRPQQDEWYRRFGD